MGFSTSTLVNSEVNAPRHYLLTKYCGVLDLTTAANTNGLALLHLTSMRFELDGSNDSTALQKFLGAFRAVRQGGEVGGRHVGILEK